MIERFHLVVGAVVVLAILAGVGVMVWTSPADSEPKKAKVVRERPDQPVELGDVRWHRGFDAALKEAKASDKPVLVLFDEVPGCHTVVTYGEQVLSHPLIVEAAEELFVPVVVYNNVEGDDRRVLESFKEPTWNNPVGRIIDADREALAPRLDGDYTVGGLAQAMVKALGRAGKASPPWLEQLAREERAHRDGTEKATFGMYCFWSGEAGFGKAEGVVGTRTGFLGGREVVEVEYDPRVMSYDTLAKYARESGAGEVAFAEPGRELSVAREVFGGRALEAGGELRPSTKDDKYHLAHTPWAYVPMTSGQATRANAMIASRRDPAELFSPRQRALYALVEKNVDAGWPTQLGMGELREGFAKAEAVARKLQSKN